MPGGPNAQAAGQWAGDEASLGVITGLVVRDPGSSTLTTTIEGGWIRQLLSTFAVQETRIADTSKAYTASKDTYVYVNAAGALAYYEVANNATKPTQAQVEAVGGVGSHVIAKVVTDGSRVTAGGVTSLRRHAAVDMRSFEFRSSFAATEVGAYYWVAPCRLRVWKIISVVEDTLAGTDTATVTMALGLNDVYTDATNGVTTMAISAATGVRATALPTASYIVSPGQTLRFTGAKSTAGGNCTTQVLYSPI